MAERVCAMCGRSSDGLDSWHTVVNYSLVGDTEWEEGTGGLVVPKRGQSVPPPEWWRA